MRLTICLDDADVDVELERVRERERSDGYTVYLFEVRDDGGGLDAVAKGTQCGYVLSAGDTTRPWLPESHGDRDVDGTVTAGWVECVAVAGKRSTWKTGPMTEDNDVRECIDDA